MIILRKQFSEKKEKDKERVKGAALTAAGIGGGIASHKLGNALNDKFVRNFLESKTTAKDNEAIFNKLTEKAKEQGVKVEKAPSINNAMYTGNKTGRKVRDLLSKYVKALRKGGNKEIAKEIVDYIQSDPTKKNIGKDKILLGGGPFSDRADVLSHELGHAQYLRPDRSKSIVGKTAHKLHAPSTLLTIGGGEGDNPTRYIGPSISFTHGVRSGIKNERNNQEGKKNNLWNKTRSVAVPLAISAPLLVAEGKASLNGLKTMKELGASKELLKQSRKNLGNAFGTYASLAGRNALIGGAGEITGRGIAKMSKKKKSED